MQLVHNPKQEGGRHKNHPEVADDMEVMLVLAQGVCPRVVLAAEAIPENDANHHTEEQKDETVPFFFFGN